MPADSPKSIDQLAPVTPAAAGCIGVSEASLSASARVRLLTPPLLAL